MRGYPKRHFAAGKSRKHRGNARQRRPKSGGATYLMAAAVAGASFGIGTVAFTPGGMAAIMTRVQPLAASLQETRARPPQPGDHWSRCDDARTAGTAPIYEGEPGYREGLDGDSDGIACEPYHGR